MKDFNVFVTTVFPEGEITYKERFDVLCRQLHREGVALDEIHKIGLCYGVKIVVEQFNMVIELEG